ncbi:hypothetical protein GEMRC1_010960 [Eukaryota sp. GEM-RC1]
MRTITLIVLGFVLASACDFSCFQSTCRTNGGKNESCHCIPLYDKGALVRHHAMCYGKTATSCEKTDYRTGCSIEGHHAECSLVARSHLYQTWYVSQCSAFYAPRCSQTVLDSNCEIIGENAKCSTTFLTHQSSVWIVPSCMAHRALQCSIKCGSSSCDKDCTGMGKRADCHCFVQSTDHHALLTSRCRCV